MYSDLGDMEGLDIELCIQLMSREDMMHYAEHHISGFLVALCAERVSQMTKTYDDIKAVTRLLEEKERDLELAAKIGQSLLERNKELHLRNEQSEEHLVAAHDKVSQLRHELTMKNKLLEVYVQDLDSSEPSDDQDLIPFEERLETSIQHLTFLQKKISQLEEENIVLKSETVSITDETSSLEEKEKMLVQNCARELAQTCEDVENLQAELVKKSDDNLKQKSELTHLLAQMADLQKKCKELSVEKIELHENLTASERHRKTLSEQVSYVQEKYDECLVMLHEHQDENRRIRRQTSQKAPRTPVAVVTPLPPLESLASELKSSVVPIFPPGYDPDERRDHTRKVMETSRAVHKPSRMRYPSGGWKKSFSPLSARETSGVGGMSYIETCGSVISDNISVTSEHTDSGTSRTASPFCSSPGLSKRNITGSNDLETELREALSQQEMDEDQEKLMNETRDSMYPSDLVEHGLYPEHCGTPESYMSLWSHDQLLYGPYGDRGHLPRKLQIIKPMEGSSTLHQWSRLATPHLGGILEERPGVAVKGEKKIDFDDVFYRLCDFEEDDDPCLQMGKQFMYTHGTYTYTTSSVQYPGELAKVTSSGVMTRADLTILPNFSSRPPHLSSSGADSLQTTPVKKPVPSLPAASTERDIHPLSRTSSTSSLASSIWLERMLNEDICNFGTATLKQLIAGNNIEEIMKQYPGYAASLFLPATTSESEQEKDTPVCTIPSVLSCSGIRPPYIPPPSGPGGMSARILSPLTSSLKETVEPEETEVSTETKLSDKLANVGIRDIRTGDNLVQITTTAVQFLQSAPSATPSYALVTSKASVSISLPKMLPVDHSKKASSSLPESFDLFARLSPIGRLRIRPGSRKGDYLI